MPAPPHIERSLAIPRTKIALLRKTVAYGLLGDYFVRMSIERLYEPKHFGFCHRSSFGTLPDKTIPFFIYKSICTGFLKNSATRATVKEERGRRDELNSCHRTGGIRARGHVRALLDGGSLPKQPPPLRSTRSEQLHPTYHPHAPDRSRTPNGGGASSPPHETCGSDTIKKSLAITARDLFIYICFIRQVPL